MKKLIIVSMMFIILFTTGCQKEDTLGSTTESLNKEISNSVNDFNTLTQRAINSKDLSQCENDNEGIKKLCEKEVKKYLASDIIINARISQDLSKCDDSIVKETYFTQSCKYWVNTEKALEQNNLDLCKYGALDESTPEINKNYFYDGCLSELAFKNNDFTTCNKGVSPINCGIFLASISGNLEACDVNIDGIRSDDKITDCILTAFIQKSKNVEFCHVNEPIFLSGLINDDVSQCLKTEFNKGLEVSKSDCEVITNSNIKQNCIDLVDRYIRLGSI